ncbi:helix-turn-helix domain-containing protein [Pseudofrankia asymbiotica]|uniref:Excisionase n=1 Tax=Pseudofrankia asymbiotica TaxID=1834516 RepID=A0A1V2I9D0_9ACTN|nr:helix-turn-helix domain-containing protein [Pseudofrankia asymbiotica]ONH29163.1 excisionase [Pseudofrankia asymbiotica]
MTPSEPTRAVYVRMPDKLAQKLDKAAERFGVSKRDLLATLVSDHLDVEGDELVFRPHGRGPGGKRTGERPDGEGAGDRPHDESATSSRGARPGDFWKKRAADAWGAGTAAGGARTEEDRAEPSAPTPAAPVSEVLTLEEAAELLRVSVDDVRALVESGDLPARRIGETWRLTRTAVLTWLGTETRTESG